MWTYYPELLARPVPRYTSYPTAAEFTSDVGAPEAERAMAQVGQDEDVSLYLHIPYCHEICWYCGCNTGAATRSRRLVAYVEALEREVSLVAAQLGGRGVVRRIAFGGGSPNALDPITFVRLLHHITVSFRTASPEVAVEVDPRSLGDQWIAMLGSAGVSRVSMGVQTFSTAVQARIGRVQPFDLIAATTRKLRAGGVRTVSFDLMYGLPGQTVADLYDSLERALTLEPDRIALFGYAHVPHLLPRQRQIDDSALPDAATRFAMAEAGYVQLTNAGYQPVGFDHFARPADTLAIAVRNGTVHRNFQGFTDDRSSVLIGLGASAISQFPTSIIQNDKNAGRYRMRLSAGQLPAERGVALTSQDGRHRQMIMDLLCKGKAHLPVDCRTQLFHDALQPFIDRALATLCDGLLTLSRDAIPYARTIAAIFDMRLNHDARRFSNAI